MCPGKTLLMQTRQHTNVHIRFKKIAERLMTQLISDIFNTVLFTSDNDRSKYGILTTKHYQYYRIFCLLT